MEEVDGDKVGVADGDEVGAADGDEVGAADGDVVGAAVGDRVGEVDGDGELHTHEPSYSAYVPALHDSHLVWPSNGCSCPFSHNLHPM